MISPSISDETETAEPRSDPNRCFYCESIVYPVGHPKAKANNKLVRTIDHLVPKCDGGTGNSPANSSNTVYACHGCNCKRGHHPAVVLLFYEAHSDWLDINTFRNKRKSFDQFIDHLITSHFQRMMAFDDLKILLGEFMWRHSPDARRILPVVLNDVLARALPRFSGTPIYRWIVNLWILREIEVSYFSKVDLIEDCDHLRAVAATSEQFYWEKLVSTLSSHDQMQVAKAINMEFEF